MSDSSPNWPGPVPEWASFLEPDEFAELMGLVRQTMNDQEFLGDLDPLQGVIHRDGPDEQERAFGLLNLFQTCRQHDRSDWPAIVADHFQRISRIDEQHASLETLTEDFDQVAPLLKIRLFADELPDEQQSVIVRELLPGIQATLVYDLPDSIVTVHPEHAMNWGRHGDELFERALANIKEQDALSRDSVDLGGAEATILAGDSFFSASHILMIGDYLSEAHNSEWGVLVAVPNRHVILLHEIQDDTVLTAINGMLIAAQGLHREGPGSISPSLYWWRQGTFHRLPATIDGSEIQFEPPPAFVAMLNEVVS